MVLFRTILVRRVSVVTVVVTGAVVSTVGFGIIIIGSIIIVVIIATKIKCPCGLVGRRVEGLGSEDSELYYPEREKPHAGLLLEDLDLVSIDEPVA